MTASSEAPATSTARATAMEPAAMAEHLRSRLGDAVTDVAIAFGQLTVTVRPESLPEAARLCKDVAELDFDFYSHNAGVDLGEDGFAVVTHLYSLRHRHQIMLRVVAPGGREAPTVPTLTHLYLGANWHEREVYDMFGIDFEGHPGLLPRILTVENFEGFPLRKDFLLSTREAKPWPGLKEPKEVGTAEEEGADATAAEGRSAPEAPTEGGQKAAPVSADEKAKASQARAERARAKAAAMRAEKQSEREAAQAATADEAGQAGTADASDESDAQAAAADKTSGGETGGEGAATAAAAAGEPEPQTPSGAADIARTDIAKDAAAGAVGGDTAAGAPGDSPDSDQPVHDPEAEAKVGEGAPPTPSGAPGAEAEGRHGPAHERDRSGEADAPTASPYADRSHPPDDAERPEPSDSLDEVGRVEDDRPSSPPEDATGGEEGTQP